MTRTGIIFRKSGTNLITSAETAVEKRTMSSHGTYNKAISYYT